MKTKEQMIELTQEWREQTSTYIMTDDGVCFATVYEYPNTKANYYYIATLCVKEEYRNQGYARRMLNYIEEKFDKKYEHKALAVEKDAPEWLVAYYNKRGYLIWEV